MNIKRVLALSAALFSTCSHISYPMESKQAPILVLENTMDQKIDVFYVYQGKMFNFTQVSKQKISINDFPNITALYVLPYGKVRSWFTLHWLPGDIFKNNLIESLKELRGAQLTRENTLLRITPGGTWVSYLVGKRIAEELTSYQYKVAILSRKKIPETVEPKIKHTPILEYFPQIQDAIDKAKPILPRYVLNIGENASSEMIDDAHEQMRLFWQEQKDSENPAQAALAAESLELINESYKNLQGLPNNFDMLVAQYQPIKQAEQPAPFTQEQQAALRTTEEAFGSE